MSQATTAARARTSHQGNLNPVAVTQTVQPVAVYTAPTLAGAAITLAPRLPLLGPEPA